MSRTETEGVNINDVCLRSHCVCHLLSISLVTSSVEAGHEYELEDAAEHKDHRGQHPDVEEGDVGDPGDALSDRGEHGGEREERGHPHPHPARHRLRGYEEREPGEHHEHRAGDVGLHHVVANLASQVQLRIIMYESVEIISRFCSLRCVFYARESRSRNNGVIEFSLIVMRAVIICRLFEFRET